jgi:hypothetical protein
MTAPLVTPFHPRVASGACDSNKSAEDRVARALEEYAAAIERGDPLSREELLTQLEAGGVSKEEQP